MRLDTKQKFNIKLLLTTNDSNPILAYQHLFNSLERKKKLIMINRITILIKHKKLII